MFASHEAASPKAGDEYRVFLIGDSSVWGTLLRPQETLSGQLNALQVNLCGKTARFYNLGYPTISVLKDLLILDYATRYEPDAILWLTTLQALPLEKQSQNPLLAENPQTVSRLMERYALPLAAPPLPGYAQRTLFMQRRALADVVRLQLYGVAWSATGIDQVYPAEYPAPQNDFLPNAEAFHNLSAPLAAESLAYPVLQAGLLRSPAPVLLINEPMFLSDGENSQTRYNFFYPRWAYDDYRAQMQAQASAYGWNYLDLWDLLPQEEFTNSAIHLSPAGELALAQRILPHLPSLCTPKEKP